MSLCYRLIIANSHIEGMQPTTLLTALFVVTSGPLILLYARRRSVTLIRDVTKARALLSKTAVETRARPNQRLVTTFSIDNAFTTTDPEYRKDFRLTANEKLQAATARWNDIVRFAKEKLDEATYASGRLEMVASIGEFVLQIVMHSFFPDISEIISLKASQVTTKINSLWLTSKKTDPTAASNFSSDREGLFSTLDMLFRRGANTIAGRENPLNWILPTYETLWRVVLRAFMEIEFHSATQDANMWKSLLQRYLQSPTPNTFDAMDGAGNSVNHIVREALRLYPPTSRIYRQSAQGKTDAVDEEHIHRIPSIWGQGDTLQFKPSRWNVGRTQLSEMNNAFFAFGEGRWPCPAGREFVPKMIGLLTAALVRRFDGYVLQDRGRNPVSLERDQPLDAGRKAYENLYLVR